MSLTIGTDSAADAARRSRLRRMRAVATGLLVLAAIVYLLTLHGSGFWGYVNSGAEASMVGAIADWFAVTALFRHPLGLPVPHTALVPKRKDDFGESLEEFFAENFLNEQVVRERLAAADVVRRLAIWAGEPDHARRVVAEAASVLGIGLNRLRDDDVAALVEQVLLPRFAAEPISPVAGSLLEQIVADGSHHGLVDLALDEAYRWLSDNEVTFTEILAERAPWWTPNRLNDAVTRRIYVESLRWVQEIRTDPWHEARVAFDSFLTQLADDLLHDADTQARAERLKERVLSHPQVVAAGLSLWSTLKRALETALAEEQGPLRARAEVEVRAFADRVVADAALRTRLEGWLADLVVWGVARYGDELTAVITQTIKRWDGKEAAERIELHVGSDLQFIRINGTVVGGLVGLLIHAISQAIG